MSNLPRYKPPSGRQVSKILYQEFGFEQSGQKGSHIRLSKKTKDGKIGIVVPLHKE